jgi:hypothetical protein
MPRYMEGLKVGTCGERNRGHGTEMILEPCGTLQERITVHFLHHYRVIPVIKLTPVKDCRMGLNKTNVLSVRRVDLLHCAVRTVCVPQQLHHRRAMMYNQSTVTSLCRWVYIRTYVQISTVTTLCMHRYTHRHNTVPHQSGKEQRRKLSSTVVHVTVRPLHPPRPLLETQNAKHRAV